MKKSYPISKKEALSRLMKLCSRSEKSAFEIELKLKSWGLQRDAEKIIRHLREENFINDSRYVKSFVHDKILLNKWGRIKIKYHLQKYNIPADVIAKELYSFDTQLYRKMIFEELNKKNSTLTQLSAQVRKLKLYTFGNQRGYETEYLREFIHEPDT